MVATILTVGDVLLTGQVVDTNATWLSRQLYDVGVQVRRVVTVGDRDRDIRDVLEQEWLKSNLFIITGGLGPTANDLTRDAVVHYFARYLRDQQEIAAEIVEYYEHHVGKVPEFLLNTAMSRMGFKALYNSAGGVPGFFYEVFAGRALFAVPGVPHEMKAIYHSEISPYIHRKRSER